MVTGDEETPDPAGPPWYTVHGNGVDDPRSGGRRSDRQSGQDDGGGQDDTRTQPARGRAEQPHAPTGTRATGAGITSNRLPRGARPSGDYKLTH